MISFVKSRWRTLALATVAVLAYFWFAVWPPEIQIANKQAGLISAMASRDTAALHSFLAPDYKDRWGFDADNAAQAFRDVSRQFDALIVDYTGVETTINPPHAQVSGHIRLSGPGNAFSATIVRQANRLEEPFTFEWRKTSWTPWSWRVFSIDHPALEAPDGYVPGDWGSTLINQF